VTITGTNYTGATAVAFGGIAATSYTVVSVTSITATVGNGASGVITITTPGGTATSSANFFLPPTITSFTPTIGGAGLVVTITGTNCTGATAVSFGGTAATSFTVVNNTSITATVGNGATGAITVTSPGGIATSASVFTYSKVPTIAGFTPPSGVTGTVVTLTGTNFTGTIAVSFGGTAAASFTVVSAGSITATVGSGTSGAITVTAPGGIVSSTGAFTYYRVPSIMSVTPIKWFTGAVVTITGANFTGATAVAFGGTAATAFTVISATTIKATVGSGAAGHITITTPGGMATSAGSYPFYPMPVITSFTPTSGNTGMVVTITGANFTGASTVTFGGTPATSFSVISDSSITATVGSGVTGNITITTLGGTAASAASFTYSMPLTAVTFVATPPTPAMVGTTVSLFATATGGTNVQFQYWLLNYNQGVTPVWSQLQAYSTSATCLWTPAATGYYLISVTAQDRFTGAIVNSTAWYAVNGTPLTAVSFLATPAAPQNTSTPITLAATATGGTNVQFQFWLYNAAATPAWSQLQAYSSSATCIWTPATAGNYLIAITAKDGITGVLVNSTVWYTITSMPLTAVTLASSPTAPQATGTPITLTATATGGTNLQYQYWIYNAAGTPAWSQLQAYSAQAAYTWTPTTAGNYLLAVSALDGTTGAIVATTAWYTITTATLIAVAASESPASPQAANTPITVTATATGGINVHYQFWIYNVNTSPAWTRLQSYSAQATCTWIPSAAGNYLLSVTAQDGVTGTEVNTTQWYTVTNSTPLTAVSVTPSLQSPQPTATHITLTAVATGGVNVQYQFWVYNQNSTPAWSQLQAYSSQNTCPWTPSTAGNYLLSVTAQDSVTGTVMNTLQWYTIQ